MFSSTRRRLECVLQADSGASLRGGLVGLEKESLRVGVDGRIANTLHPPALGSALTHPYITTDYSEALLEFITPPMQDRTAVLEHLRATHKFAYERIGEETLWATSMPCVLEGGAKIPIAHYGSSNQGRMKTIYRRGLGHRYGRSMQVIAGVHYNYSLPDVFWPLFHELERSSLDFQDFISESYMGMIRNLQRFGWLVPYLFGASPTVCPSFVAGKETDLEEFDSSTLYYPYATSLRMGDIGYQNSLEEGRGFKANYDSLDAYIRSLTWAISTSCPESEAIGVKVDGQYRQLSANVLQIENEHYSTIRPKQIPIGMEMPTMALRRSGVCYVELRSIDVNAQDPLGVSEQQLHFFETFLIFCLLTDAPRINAIESKLIDANQILVAHHGRKPGLQLRTLDGALGLRDFARALLTAMLPIARVLDEELPHRPYSRAVKRQLEVAASPELTPSARMLREMRETEEGFFAYSSRMSKAHRDYFLDMPEDVPTRDALMQVARESILHQSEIEYAAAPPFEDFLRSYFEQI